MNKVVMMLVAGCVVGMLTGCGVPKEEHEAKIAELNKAWEDIETLKGEKASLEESLKEEQKKARSLRVELDDASKTVEELKAQESSTAAALTAKESKIGQLERDLSSTQSAKKAADVRISEVEAALAKLQAEYDQLLNRFNQLKKNMMALGGDVSPGEAPMSVEAPQAAAEAPKSGSKAALDLLDEMGMQ